MPGWLRRLGFVPALAVLLVTGFRGLDFGVHWDEDLRIRMLQKMADAPGLLPDDYHYPTMVHWLGLVSALPELAARETAEDGTRAPLDLSDRAFRLRWRGAFLVVSSLAVLWLYLLVLRWRGSVAEAVVASALLACSWEVAYHLRWIGPDGLLMQFAALALLGAVLGAHERAGRWILLGAVAAGLGAGSKYTGGLLIVPVLLAAFFSAPTGERRELAATARALLIPCVAFLVAFLLTTPGALFEHEAFRRDIAWQQEHYSTGHANYTVEPGGQHLKSSLVYLGRTFFAHWPVVAWPLFLLVPLGAWALLRERLALALVILALPLLHVAYMATQSVMLARNLLQLGPVLALLAARGAAWLWSLAPRRHLRAGLAAAMAAALVANAGWLFRAAESIAHRRGDDAHVAALEHVRAHPGTRFLASPLVARDLDITALANVVTDPEAEADSALLYASEGMAWSEWPTREPGLTERWFGPHEVNFDVYPSWVGDDRILLLDLKTARAIGVRTVRPDLPADPIALFRQAFHLQRNGEPQGAIDRYERFLELDPQHYQAWFNLGYARMELDRRAEAIEDFSRCLAIKPDYHEAHLHLERCLVALGREQEAAAHRKQYDARPR